jgi:hypothetical protein
MATTTFLCFSVANVLAQAAGLAVVWQRGGLTKDCCVQILAIAHDVDTAEMWDKLQEETHHETHEQASYDEVRAARARVNVDLDLREMAFDKGWIDIRNLESLLEKERERYAQLKQTFDRQLNRLHQGSDDSSEVQRQLESIDPKLAKDQILRILENEALDPDMRMQFVVAIFRNMTLDKRKRILSTFRDEDREVERLHEILRQVRRGVPEVSLIRDTRRQLEKFERER